MRQFVPEHKTEEHKIVHRRRTHDTVQVNKTNEYTIM